MFWKQVLLLLFLILTLLGTFISGQNAAPHNLKYTIARNDCAIVEINLTWTQPNASLEVKNYVITYWMKHYITNVTVKGETNVITADNGTAGNLTISENQINAFVKVSANYSHGNSTFITGPASHPVALMIVNLSCGFTNDDKESPGTMYVVKLAAIIVCGSVGLIIFFFAALRTYVWKMERKYDQNDLSQSEKRGHDLMLISHQLPISTENFFDHVSSMKFNHNRGFNIEWTKLSCQSKQSCSFGNHPLNAAKNRFANVPTFDVTRVVLREVNGKPNTTYINANFVDNLEWPKAYVATQAPLPETVADFWRMIWEEEINCIVMILDMREKNGVSCSQYWPDEGKCTYGQLTIKLLETTSHADYLIRSLEVRHLLSLEFRLVRQFHYHSWPSSKKVPVHPTSFLDFVKKVASFRVNNVQPIVVQCSSGNGRTGVYIVLDTQLKRIEKQNDINIFFNVDSIRHQRYQIIRNLEEYIFIHECILDHLICLQNVDILPRNLSELIERKKEKNAKGGNGFQIEFTDVLNDMTAIYNRFDAAKLPQNKSKNRFENILPFDHTRVKLRRGNASSPDIHDYVNASYCSNMTRKRRFIITQNPLETTCFDFWCMVWENSCLAIIMLSIQEEDIFSYWPEVNEVLKAGKIEVRCISIERLTDVDIRHLEILHTEHSKSRLVRHFQYKCWPVNTDENSVRKFVDFVVQCNKWHATSHERTAVVHCKAGTGKSGSFVATSLLVERLNVEHVVNVYKAVKNLRRERIAAIQTTAQYELVYLAIECYFKAHYLRGNEERNDEQVDEDFSSMIDTSIGFEQNSNE